MRSAGSYIRETPASLMGTVRESTPRLLAQAAKPSNLPFFPLDSAILSDHFHLLPTNDPFDRQFVSQYPHKPMHPHPHRWLRNSQERAWVYIYMGMRIRNSYKIYQSASYGRNVSLSRSTSVLQTRNSTPARSTRCQMGLDPDTK